MRDLLNGSGTAQLLQTSVDVIWFILDTLRADHLGCYGYFRQTSPKIDRLAGESLLSEDSYASAIATGPGFTSLFTGLAAINHGFYLI